MRQSICRRTGVLLAVAALAASSAQPTQAAPGVRAAVAGALRVQAPAPTATLPLEVILAALRAPGTVARQGARLTVERIRVPARLRSTYPEVPGIVWRVSFAGRFPRLGRSATSSSPEAGRSATACPAAISAR